MLEFVYQEQLINVEDTYKEKELLYEITLNPLQEQKEGRWRLHSMQEDYIMSNNANILHI
jgi:hypothetical protein